MSNYNFDREFTDYIHYNLAVPLIYDKLNWKLQTMNKKVVDNVDVFNAVDCFLVDMNTSTIVTVQERFREAKYMNYSDFTIRYKRIFNQHEERKMSEYFKLEADYFVYGIVNSSKYERGNCTDFIKFAVIDISILKELINENKIIVDEKLNSIRCIERNGNLICPQNFNRDHSSSFIPIDIILLKKLFPDRKVVKFSKGF